MPIPSDQDLVASAADRLRLQSRGVADERDLAQLEALAGGKLPALVSAFLRRFSACSNVNVRFGGDTVLFYSVPEILEEITRQDIGGMGAVPFGYDHTSSLWFVMLRPAPDGAPPERVDFIPVQEIWTDPDNPIEHRAESFETFLRGLSSESADD